MKIDPEITFRKLQIFMIFMEKGNIARTADALNISGVSVHRALHSLEEGIRCPLFIHKGRNLVPLASAQTLLEYTKEVIMLMVQGIGETRQVAGVGQGTLRIGTLYSLTLETVPKLIMGMKRRRHELEIDLTMGSNKTLLDRLEDGALDAILISISESEIDHSRFEVLRLFDDDVFLAAPIGFQHDTSQPVDLKEYTDRNFVSLTEGFATCMDFQAAFHMAGIEPEIVTYVNDIFSLGNLVRAGVGLTLLPGRMKKEYGDSMQFLKLAEQYQLRQTIAIVFARNGELAPNLLALAAEGRMYARSFIT